MVLGRLILGCVLCVAFSSVGQTFSIYQTVSKYRISDKITVIISLSETEMFTAEEGTLPCMPAALTMR